MMMSKILFAPHVEIARGFAQMSALMATTLGPNRGVIWNRIGSGKPERLTDSGIIARRVTELNGVGENAGAMILRGAIMQMHERYLDGGALTATLALNLMESGSHMLAAGINPMALRSGIERAAAAAVDAIRVNARMVTSQDELAQVAYTATGDHELADVLGEMFEILGKQGAYVVDEYAAPLLDREYVEGGRWEARPAARELMPPASADLTLDQPLIFVTNDKIERLAQIRAALEAAISAPGKPPLLIIAREITGEALTALTLNHTRGTLTAAAVTPLSMGADVQADLVDISLLVGAQLADHAAGSAAESARGAWLGRARQVIVKRDSLTIIGGAGDLNAKQRRITELRTQLKQIKTPDDTWERLRLRIARLSGGLGILKIGAQTFHERDMRKEAAKKAVRVLETALDGGVAAGGGVAYLSAIPAANAVRGGSAEENAGVYLVRRALKAPFVQIACNYGRVHPYVALHDVQQEGATVGFDARTGTYAEMFDAGILDSVPILCAALETAASAAIMALTTGVVIVGK